MTFEEARDHILGRARARGVGAEVLARRVRELTVRAHEGRVEQVTQAVQGGIGVRVVADGRVGYAYTEELSPAALDWVFDEAVENAALQASQEGVLPAGGALGTHDLLGDALEAPIEAKILAAKGFEATLREDPRAAHVLIAAYSEREQQVLVASTTGVDGAYRTGAAGIGGSVVMQDGASRKQAWEMEWARGVHGLDPGRTAYDITQRTGRLLGARPLATGRYTAYLEPKALTALLAVFWHLWSGRAVVEKKSRLAGRLDESIAAPAVTLVDDPTQPNGLASRPFDAEGTPARPTTLVERGVLRTFLTNAETARALRLSNTGHAARGYRSVVGVAPSNLYLAPGTGVRMGDGVLVTEVMGVHAGANPVSGEFSVQAFGLRVKDGEIAYPVENFAVAGDFLTLLRQISAVGQTLRWDLHGTSAFGAPLVEVQDLSFAGA